MPYRRCGRFRRPAVQRAADRIAAIEIGPRFHPGHTACPSCVRIGHEQAFPEERAQAADASADLPPAMAEDSAATAWPGPPDVLDLTTSPRRQLVPADGAACTPGLLDEQTVSFLLSRTAGSREASGAQDGFVSRWCPSGGNRASVQLFLLTEERWPQLPGTVFKYDEGTLIAARADTPSLPELLAGTGLEGRPVRAAVVITGAVHRLRGKYGDFAFRLTHLDAGCALAQAALLAAELGLRAELVTGGVGDLGAQLGLHPADQLAIGIMGLYGRDTGDAAAGSA